MNNQIQQLSAPTKPPYTKNNERNLNLQRRALEHEPPLNTSHLLWDSLQNDWILSINQADFDLGWASFITTQSMTIQGAPLDEVYAEAQKLRLPRRSLPFLAHKMPSLLPFGQISQQFAMNLTGESSFFADNQVDEVELVTRLSAMHVKSPLSWYYILKSQQFYLFDNHIEAAKMMQASENILDLSWEEAQVVEHHFYHSLILSAIYPNTTPTAQRYYWKKLIANLDIIKQSADRSPEQFEHKYLLVAAEMARLSGNDHEAMDLYDAALTSANEHGFIQNEALANERFAKFWLAKGKEQYAQIHMISAHVGYQLWGAKRKVRDMEQKYARWLRPTATRMSHDRHHRHDQFPVTCAAANPVDLSGVFKACQAMSEEMDLAWLLEQIMHIILDYSSAERGVIILEEEGELLIEAERKARSNSTNVLQSVPIHHPKACKLSTAIVDIVARTKEPIIYNHDHHATSSTAFSHDPYLRQEKPTSVLCMPLLNGGQLNGIFYLENHLSTGAFTAERLDVLKCLSWQAAISIEKARLEQ